MSNRYPNGKPASDYRVVWIYGPPASGKLTIARELSTLTQLPVFHNHLAVDGWIEQSGAKALLRSALQLFHGGIDIL